VTCTVAKHLADSFKNKTTRGKCASEPLLVSRLLGDAMDSERAAIVAELAAKMREPTPSSDNGTCASVVVLSSMFAGGTHTLDVAARVELTPNAASFDGYLRVVLSFVCQLDVGSRALSVADAFAVHLLSRQRARQRVVDRTSRESLRQSTLSWQSATTARISTSTRSSCVTSSPQSRRTFASTTASQTSRNCAQFCSLIR
jgi:hypothetical protein